MTRWARFGIGGLGGLLPVLASLLAVDLTAVAAIVDHQDTVSLGLCVGYTLRVLVLFTLGGVMAMLNSEIQKFPGTCSDRHCCTRFTDIFCERLCYKSDPKARKAGTIAH